jgi:hypothetical protein
VYVILSIESSVLNPRCECVTFLKEGKDVLCELGEEETFTDKSRPSIRKVGPRPVSQKDIFEEVTIFVFLLNCQR